MSPSRWPRSPLPGKCSKRFCGSSRNCGRSHHQGQHETFDSHALKSNRQKECVQMPGKMARSDPRPGVRVTRGAGSGQHLASVLQDGRENANIDAGLGFIWRISDKACPIKRPRRTRAEIDEIKSAIRAVLKADHPMTVRQVFYQLVVRNVIEKTEEQYQGL